MSLPASALAAVATDRTPSSVVISNLAYLVGAVVLAVLIICVMVIVHRRPRSTEDDMNDFHRGLAALNPNRSTHHRSSPLRRSATRPRIPAGGATPRRPSTRSKSG